MAAGQFELKNGNLFVLAEAAGGVYNGSQLRLICDVADDVSVFLKVTEDQRIGFMVPKDKLLELHAKLSKAGILLKHYRNHSILSPKACLGELCPKCEQDALGDAIEISPILNEKFKDSFTALTIGMNGCAVACVASATDDIHIVGDSKGYNMSIGGRVSGEPKLSEPVIEAIPRAKIGQAIANVLDTYSQNKQGAENLSEVVSRLGIAAFKDAIEKGALADSVEAAAEEEVLLEADAPPSAEEAAPAEAAAEEVPLEADAPPAEEAAPAEAAAEEVPLEADAPPAEEAAPAEAAAEEVPLEADAPPSAEEAAPAEADAEEEVPLEADAAAEEVPLEADAPPSADEGVATESVIEESTEEAPQTENATAPEEEDAAAVPIQEESLEVSSDSASESSDEDIAAEPVDETPLDASSAEPVPPSESAESAAEAEAVPEVDASTSETPPEADAPVADAEEASVADVKEEEAPLEVAGTEEVPAIEASENASEDVAPLEMAGAAEVPKGEESMSEQEKPAEEVPVEGASAEMKDLEIVDDTSDSGAAPAAQEDHPAPEPIDHGMGEDVSLQNAAPQSEGGGGSESIGEDASIGLDEDADPSHIPTTSNKTSIQVRGDYVTVVLSDGSDFRIPYKHIEEGKVIEMQVEDEVFIIENVAGKLQVKYGDFEMHVPLTHGTLEDEENDAAAA
ncbi:hypothetical protein [Silvanigrella aquatica]|uniref:Nitrite/sulphite reductase 4Fe-4S domain-containing protein n=1 Tax=Silvanigrella aquatica TaxID=1915309 RepID=A0A1L4D0U3_9BACT|nr:hypothetical protein [Silvanigrella aquatica]APJ03833.1 hypothetical protein AXG55_07905 [Silvanigrella aquatica]